MNVDHYLFILTMLEVYQNSRPPAHSAPKCNSKFEILIVKIFSLKQKTNQILPTTTGKIKFSLFKKTTPCSFRL